MSLLNLSSIYTNKEIIKLNKYKLDNEDDAYSNETPKKTDIYKGAKTLLNKYKRFPLKFQLQKGGGKLTYKRDF